MQTKMEFVDRLKLYALAIVCEIVLAAVWFIAPSL